MKLNVTSILILTEIFPSVHETCYLKTLILHLAITEILTRDHSLSNSLFHLTDDVRINTFKYHVLCADGKISIRVNLLYYRFFHRRPIQQLCVSFLWAFRRCQETEETSTPSRPVENVVLTTKGPQERNTQLLDGTRVEK